ncbi:hypothetical protein AOQ84DRAFT_166785 [Glonium stellatum]|uniref:Uncharacterized protein n=1 Tax=Glonium stellatum TaxID=574774 RepID=A0A8E2JWC6_9PEZI|nr:hypothetical protein AOQ84DRAFT_166785 [Glonium stellatum]
MRLSTYTILLLPTLSACLVVSPHPAYPPSLSVIPSTPTASLRNATAPPTAAATADPANPNLELREIVAGAAPTLTQTAAPVVSTQWVETTIGGVVTWVAHVYTQTFAAVPSQLPEPGKGEIGMGTLTGQVGVTKTVDAGAVETGRSVMWKKGAIAAGAVVVGLVV